MRWVDFRALRDLLSLVGAHANGLRANELERLATSKGVLLRRDGQPYARSIHYHHRRTLERLGLLVRHGRFYALNTSLAEVGALTAGAQLGEPLQAHEKEGFANAVLRNQDCHDAFFSTFVSSQEPVRDVRRFVADAAPAEMVVESGGRASGGTHSEPPHPMRALPKQVAMRPVGATEWRVLKGANAVQAVHFGLRTWCADQLGFMDVARSADGTYTLYPTHIVPRLSEQELSAMMLDAIEFDGDWATVRIPDCALETGIALHVPIEQAKEVLRGWLTEHPDLVDGVATRIGFITHGLADSQQALALKSYLRSNRGAYLSHLKIHRTLRQHVRNGGSGS